MNKIQITSVILGISALAIALPSPAGAAVEPTTLHLAAADKQQLSAVDLYNRGVDKLDGGDYKGAIADFDAAIRLDPNDSEAFYNRAYTRHILGQVQEAINDYTEAIRIKPQYANAYGNRGYAH